MAAPNRYSTLQITLHWVIALLVVIQLSVHDGIREAFRRRTGPDAALFTDGIEAGALFHILSGLTILGLTILRLAIRLVRGIPGPEEGIPPLVAGIATLTHVALYGFLLLMPVTGAMAWVFGSAVMATFHEIGRLILVPLVIAHALAALVEHFVLRNDTLRRMLRSTER
jgi:cytochrome b561